MAMTHTRCSECTGEIFTFAKMQRLPELWASFKQTIVTATRISDLRGIKAKEPQKGTWESFKDWVRLASDTGPSEITMMNQNIDKVLSINKQVIGHQDIRTIHTVTITMTITITHITISTTIITITSRWPIRHDHGHHHHCHHHH